MTHTVCVLHCPYCGHEKALTGIQKRCVSQYQCKQCKRVSSAKLHQTIFEFDDVSVHQPLTEKIF